MDIHAKTDELVVSANALAQGVLSLDAAIGDGGTTRIPSFEDIGSVTSPLALCEGAFDTYPAGLYANNADAWELVGPGTAQPGPQGEPGQDGQAATIAVGTVTTGAPGSSASVVNTGTSSAAVLSFAIPRGNAGADGQPGVFVADFAYRQAVLSSDGTWTATGNGFVQRVAVVTHPSTAYATFAITVNGVVAWTTQYAGLQSSGIYDFTSPPLPIRAGDIIATTSNGSGIASTLYFVPPRNVVTPQYEVDAAPTANSRNLVESGGTYSAIKTVADGVGAINAVIPSNATAQNQLATAGFVNSSIEAMAANRVRYNAANDDFPTYAAFGNAITTGTFYYQGVPYTPTRNDYAGIMADETQGGFYTRYVFDGALWGIQSILNNTSFTQGQMDAINSGVTAGVISALQTGKASTGDLAAEALARQQADANLQTAIDNSKKITKQPLTIASNGVTAVQPGVRNVITVNSGVTAITLQLNDSAAESGYAQEFSLAVKPFPGAAPAVTIAYASGAAVLFDEAWPGFEAGFHHELNVIDGLAAGARFAAGV